MKNIIKNTFVNFFYLLALCFILISGPLEANDLFESNNILENATPIYVDDSIFQSHQFTSIDDEDWMVFYVNVGGDYPYDISIPDDSVDNNTNPVIEIYNESGERLRHHDIGFEGEGEHIASWRAPSAGYYYLRVFNKLKTEESVGGQYLIHLWRAVFPVVSDDSIDEAVPIFSNDKLFIANKFDSAVDEDWKFFYADAAIPYKIKILDNSVDVNTDPVIEIYNASGERLWQEDFNFAGEGEFIPNWRAPADDFYYLRIYDKIKTELGINQYIVEVGEATAPLKSLILGKVFDQCTGKDISRANIATEFGKTLSHRTGDYGMPIFPGSYALTASAKKYKAKSRPVIVEEKKRLIADFQLVPDGGCSEYSATYDEGAGTIKLLDVLAYGVRYVVKLQDQGGLLFKLISAIPLSSEILSLPALYDAESLKLSIPSLQVSTQVYSVILVNKGDFLFAVESVQTIQ